MNKKELVALLDENEIEYPAKATVAELEKLALDNELIEEEAGDEDEEAEEDAEDEADEPASKGASVDVLEGDQYIRTYSKKVHGADFKKLAEGFAGKNAKRSVVDSATIKKLIVTFRVKNKPETVVLTANDGADFKTQALALAKKNAGDVAVR